MTKTDPFNFFWEPLRTQDSRTPLHWAASGGHLDVIAYLLANGAGVDKTDDNGWTALHIAVSSGHEEVVRELVGAAADVNKKNDKGITPLFVF
ncbi:ankyrin repeat-containing domain protein [Lactarius indigo]|nr:ankyrin repeat-containing domain protein [Lactarius indigo]